MRLLPVISLMMIFQEISATGYSPHELFRGRPAWFLPAPYPQNSYSNVGKWVEEQQNKVHKAKAMLQRVRERQWNKENKQPEPASYQEGDRVLVLVMCMTNFDRNENEKFLIFVSMKNSKNCLLKK